MAENTFSSLASKPEKLHAHKVSILIPCQGCRDYMGEPKTETSMENA